MLFSILSASPSIFFTLLASGADPRTSGIQNWNNLLNTGSVDWDKPFLHDVKTLSSKDAYHGLEKAFLIMFNFFLFPHADDHFAVFVGPGVFLAYKDSFTHIQEKIINSEHDINIPERAFIWIHVPRNNVSSHDLFLKDSQADLHRFY